MPLPIDISDFVKNPFEGEVCEDHEGYILKVTYDDHETLHISVHQEINIADSLLNPVRVYLTVGYDGSHLLIGDEIAENSEIKPNQETTLQLIAAYRKFSLEIRNLNESINIDYHPRLTEGTLGYRNIYMSLASEITPKVKAHELTWEEAHQVIDSVMSNLKEHNPSEIDDDLIDSYLQDAIFDVIEM